MSKATIYEIDDLLIRTNKIYLSYSVVTLSGLLIAGSYWKTSRLKKAFVIVPSWLFTTGMCTWLHVFKTYNQQERVFLKVGLDREYSKIKKA